MPWFSLIVPLASDAPPPACHAIGWPPLVVVAPPSALIGGIAYGTKHPPAQQTTTRSRATTSTNSATHAPAKAQCFRCNHVWCVFTCDPARGGKTTTENQR